MPARRRDKAVRYGGQPPVGGRFRQPYRTPFFRLTPAFSLRPLRKNGCVSVAVEFACCPDVHLGLHKFPPLNCDSEDLGLISSLLTRRYWENSGQFRFHRSGICSSSAGSLARCEIDACLRRVRGPSSRSPTGRPPRHHLQPPSTHTLNTALWRQGRARGGGADGAGRGGAGGAGAWPGPRPRPRRRPRSGRRWRSCCAADGGRGQGASKRSGRVEWLCAGWKRRGAAGGKGWNGGTGGCPRFGGGGGRWWRG